MYYRSIEEIKAANLAAGQHWFDTETVEWFGSRILPEVYGGRYFVSSEQDRHGAWDGERRYTVRECDADGDVSRAQGTEFGEYATAEDAMEAAKALAAQTVK